MLTALVAFIIYPFIVQNYSFPIPNNLISMSVLVFKELFIGILIGFCAQLIFTGIQIGGQLLSIQMGLAIAETLDPVTQQNVPVVGQFYLYVASIVFIYLNGHQLLFQTVFASYNTIPIDMNFSFTADITQKILYFTSQLFAIAFRIVMPLFGLLFVVDIALGFTSKIMPQMNIFMVSLPLKIFIGLSFMSLFMPTTAVYISTLISNLLETVMNIFI
jgi:flagellar biosynthetic protein FliR